jgi:hypothetical protein
VFVPAVGDRDSDDLRQNSSALFPPEFYLQLLANETVKQLIGAESTYSECPDAPFELFERTGDVRHSLCFSKERRSKNDPTGCTDLASRAIRTSKLGTEDAYLGVHISNKLDTADFAELRPSLGR